MGMGHCLTGMADDASAVYFNPGGLVFNDKAPWHFEVYGYYAFTKFEYTENSITDKSDEPVILPSFFVSRASENWGVGLGFYVPYAGGGTAYDNFQNSGHDLECSMAFPAITLALARKVRPDLSLGVGMSVYLGSMERTNYYVPNLSLLLQTYSEYDGLAGYGGHIGIMYKPTSKFSFGITSWNEITVEMNGEEEIGGIKRDSEVELTLPSVFSAGFAYTPSRHYSIGLSFFYYLYSDTDRITIKTAGAKRDTKTYYRNSWTVGLGSEYRMKDNLTVRGGIKFDQSATKDGRLNPATVDTDLITPSINIAYDISKTTEINIAAFRSFGLEEKVNSIKYNKNFMTFLVAVRFSH